MYNNNKFENMHRKTSLKILMILTCLMFLAEVFFGYYTNSIALVTDSFHMLSDVLAMFIAFYCIKLAERQTFSSHHTYGWQRAETVGALVNSTFLLALCFTLFISVIQRLVSPIEISDPLIVFIVGCVGLSINIIGLVLFHDHAHSSFSTTNDAHTQTHSHLNMKGVFIHILGDALGSVGVIISAVVTKWTNLPLKKYADPIASLIITCIIVLTTVPLFKKTTKIILHIAPEDLSIETLKNELLNLEFVKDIHEFHIWQLSDVKTIATVHAIVFNIDENNTKIIKHILHSHGIHNTTIQLESHDDNLQNNDLQELNDCSQKCIQETCAGKTCC